jgi:hypothetical protein
MNKTEFLKKWTHDISNVSRGYFEKDLDEYAQHVSRGVAFDCVTDYALYLLDLMKDDNQSQSKCVGVWFNKWYSKWYPNHQNQQQ